MPRTHNHNNTFQCLCSRATTVHNTTEQYVIASEYEFILPPLTPPTSPMVTFSFPLPISMSVEGSPGPPTFVLPPPPSPLSPGPPMFPGVAGVSELVLPLPV